MTIILSRMLFTLLLLHLTFSMIATAAYIDYSGAISGETDNMNAPQSGWLIRKFYNRSPPIAYDSNDQKGNMVWMYSDNTNSKPELRGYNNLRSSLPSSDWLQAEKRVEKRAMFRLGKRAMFRLGKKIRVKNSVLQLE